MTQLNGQLAERYNYRCNCYLEREDIGMGKKKPWFKMTFPLRQWNYNAVVVLSTYKNGHSYLGEEMMQIYREMNYSPEEAKKKAQEALTTFYMASSRLTKRKKAPFIVKLRPHDPHLIKQKKLDRNNKT